MKREEEEKQMLYRAHISFGAALSVLAFFAGGLLPLGWAETAQNRSIFQQAKVVEGTLEKPPILEKTPPSLQALGLGEIQIPETYGRIVDVYKGTSDKTIIHIQDAHVHYEAQKNVAGILESLIRKNQVRLILVEGGSLRGELVSLRKIASREARQDVAERYLEKGLLSGDEYLELVSDYPMIRQGIENPELYEENLRTFVEIDRIQKGTLGRLETLRQLVETLKEKTYSPAHLEFEEKRKAYESEQMDLAAYYAYLTSLKSPEPYPNLRQFLEASRLETQIDFEAVDGERDALLSVLEGKLSGEEMDLLVEKSLSYTEGTLSQKAYYDHLKTLAEGKGLTWETTPNLEKYIYYLSLYSDIHHVELFREGERLEEEIRESLMISEDERQLFAIARHLTLLSQLLQIRISPGDFAAYQKDRLRFSVKTVLPFLEKKKVEQKVSLALPEGLEDIDDHLKTMDRFYRIAQARDGAFVENSLKEMEKENVQTAVLKTGGFHTPGLTQILKERGISYIVISPRITEAGNPGLYYSVLKEKYGRIVQ